MPRFSPFTKTFLIILLALVLIGMAAGGCAPMAAPPDADVIAGGVSGHAGVDFLHWDEGLAIMIWRDFVGESASSATSESAAPGTAPMYKLSGYAVSRDGNRFDWEVRTSDGRTAQFWINGTSYDLAGGRLFIVSTKDGGAGIMQLHRDLSGVQPTFASCLAFAKNDPELARFIGELSATPVASPAAETSQSPPPQPPTPTATPIPPTATPIPPTLAPPPPPAAERIRFAPGATQATFDGYLPEGGRARYVMHVQAGQFVEMNAAAGASG